MSGPCKEEKTNTLAWVTQDGLFDEIKSLRKQVVDGQVKLPGQDLEKYQRGLWQAIGKSLVRKCRGCTLADDYFPHTRLQRIRSLFFSH